jgi:hypothetical protein
MRAGAVLHCGIVPRSCGFCKRRAAGFLDVDADEAPFPTPHLRGAQRVRLDEVNEPGPHFGDPTLLVQLSHELRSPDSSLPLRVTRWVDSAAASPTNQR